MNGPKAAPVGDNWTIALMQLLGYPAFFIMGLPPLWRRRNYEAFKYLHYAFLVLIPATLLHAESAWYFMLGGVAFWLVDLGIRLVTALEATPLLSATAHDAQAGVTELVFKKHFEEPGGYCFINVPAVSLWEWHPFSLCSSPMDDAAQMCIKNWGPGSFTGRLFELVKSQPAGGFVVNVDGPYGPALDLQGCEALHLLAGGVGITPLHSSFRTLAQLARKHELPSSLARVELVWAGRSTVLFSILLDSLKECLREVPQDGPSFRVRLFLDNPDPKAAADHGAEIASLKGDSCPPSLEVSAGRPALGALCAEVAGATSSGKAVFQVCGPPGMAAAAEKAAAQHSSIQFDSQLFVL
jgi:NAD(P)H-flavin reductase